MRQIQLDGWERLTNPSFKNASLRPGTDTELCTLQYVFMATVLDKILLSPHRLRIVRRFKEHPWDLWDHHEAHQTSSSLSQRIAIFLSWKLATMKISEAKS